MYETKREPDVVPMVDLPRMHFHKKDFGNHSQVHEDDVSFGSRIAD